MQLRLSAVELARAHLHADALVPSKLLRRNASLHNASRLATTAATTIASATTAQLRPLLRQPPLS